MKKIRLFLVDDSLPVIKLLKKISCTDDEIEVVGYAQKGKEAINKILAIKPDVIILDIELPEMNGIEVLKYLMRNHPVPVLIFSSFTYEGAKVTNKALMEGALDFILKPDTYKNFEGIRKEVISKIKIISKVKMVTRFNLEKSRIKKPNHPLSLPVTKLKTNKKIITIGVSTGGPCTLKTLLSGISYNLNVPVVIAQHMPPNFTKVLAEELDKISTLKVKEVQHNEDICNSTVYIGQGGKNLGITKNFKFKIWDGDTPALPSADTLFESAAETFGKNVIGVVLTGMGKDGLYGAEKIKKNGGIVIAESRKSAIIYGMPKAVIDAGLADTEADIIKIPEILKKYI